MEIFELALDFLFLFCFCLFFRVGMNFGGPVFGFVFGCFCENAFLRKCFSCWEYTTLKNKKQVFSLVFGKKKW